MIRWGYLLPRIACAVVLGGVVLFAVGPALRSLVCSSLRQGLGVDAQVDRVRFDVAAGAFVAENVRLASPSSKDAVFVIPQAALDLDAAALTRRRLIVDEVSATGVEASADEILASIGRTRIDLAPPPFAARDLAEALASVELDVETLLRESSTYVTGEQIVKEWETRLELLKRRAKLLEARVALLEKESSELRTNPLRAVDRLAVIAKELESVRTESDTLVKELKGLPNQIEADRLRLREAKNQDLAKLRAIPEAIKAEPRQIAESLIGEDRLETAKLAYRWAVAIRELASPDLEPERAAGRNVLFPSLSGEPDLLVRRFACDGTMRSGDETYPFALVCTNWTPQPRRVVEPLVVDFFVEKPLPTRVQAVIDRTGDRPRDTLLVEVRSKEAVRFELGKETAWALAASAREVTCTVHAEFVGERIEGAAVLRHQGVALDPVGEDSQRSELVAAIGEAVATIDAFDVAIRFEGDRESPKFEFATDLADRLAPAFEKVAAERLARRRVQLETQLAGSFDAIEQRVLDRVKQRNGELAAAVPKLPSLAELERTVVERINPKLDLNVPREALKLPNLLRR